MLRSFFRMIMHLPTEQRVFKLLFFMRVGVCVCVCVCVHISSFSRHGATTAFISRYDPDYLVNRSNIQCHPHSN